MTRSLNGEKGMRSRTLDILFTGRVIDFRVVKSFQKRESGKYKGKLFRGLVVKQNCNNFTTDEPFVRVTILTPGEEFQFNHINLNTVEVVDEAGALVFKLEYEDLFNKALS